MLQKNDPSLTDLPSLVKGLEIEVISPVLIRLTHIIVQKLLKIGNRCRRRPITLISCIRRSLSRALLDHPINNITKLIYRWPARLCNIHRRAVAHRVGREDIRILEELIGPPCSSINRYVAEPRVYVCHLRILNTGWIIYLGVKIPRSR